MPSGVQATGCSGEIALPEEIKSKTKSKIKTVITGTNQ